MNQRYLSQIRERAAVATPGPWEYWEHRDVNYRGEHLHGVSFDGSGNETHCCRPEDSKFIAHARQDIPALLVELDALCTENERLREVERKALDQSEYIQKHGLTEWEMALKDAEIDRMRREARLPSADVYRLRDALKDAIECVEMWGGYASPYFRAKHDFDGDLARLKAAQEAG